MTPTISILGKLGGRKFLVAILGVVALALHNYTGIDQNTVYMIGGMVISYILGQGISDGMTGGVTSSTTPITDPAAIAKSNAVAEMAKAGTEDIAEIIKKL